MFKQVENPYNYDDTFNARNHRTFKAGSQAQMKADARALLALPKAEHTRSIDYEEGGVDTEVVVVIEMPRFKYEALKQIAVSLIESNEREG